jgi:hypothetical protein
VQHTNLYRPLTLALALLTVSGAAADISVVDPEDKRAVARESDPRNTPIQRRAVAMNVDSGTVLAGAPADASIVRHVQVPVWSTEVEVADAAWVRLRFGNIELAPATDTTRASYIRITSLYDGHEQYLDAQSVREWANTSAYFNGGRLLIEIMASPTASPMPNRVEVIGATASEPTQFPRSICGPTDDRLLSSDPRDGRMMPIGCTGWLFGDQPNSFLSAGHCGPGAGDVMQFNVPLSTAGGTPQNPGPEDQYPIDPASVQTQIGGTFIGNDWAFYGAFDNSNTGLSPQDAQGDSHTLATSMPPADQRPIRITGYGSTSSPISPTWYLVQKTHTGPFTNVSGNTVQYRPDTTGGNSGSAILDENNNVVIGIHTNAGCSSTGGANQGCSLFNNDLQAALADPQGITQPQGLDMVFVGLRPDMIDPAGGDSISIGVLPDNGLSPTGSVTMFVDTGSGFQPIAMNAAGGDVYTASFPASTCGENVRYYFAADDNAGGSWQLPFSGASGAYSTLSANGITTALSEDFEVGAGWTVQDIALTSGSWDRAIPTDFGRSEPGSDADGSGRAYVTGNTNQEDVDGGPTYLISPDIDISALTDPIVSFARWHQSNGGDPFTVDFSTNNGASWTNADTFTANSSGWDTVEIRVADHVASGGTLRVRFGSSDNPNGSITESGVDAFKVIDVVCSTTCAADLAAPFGELNFFDISAYITLFNAGDAAADFAAPFGTINFFDISEYIAQFNAGCP